MQAGAFEDFSAGAFKINGWARLTLESQAEAKTNHHKHRAVVVREPIILEGELFLLL